jgi:hypothetical protein
MGKMPLGIKVGIACAGIYRFRLEKDVFRDFCENLKI